MPNVRNALLSAAPIFANAVFSTLPAGAAEVDAKSRIEAVIVYPDAASVSRMAEIEIPSGSTTLVYRGLPLGIDTGSLRVEGEADTRVVIGSVEMRTAPAVVKPQDTALEAKLKSLRSDREGWGATIEALEAKKAMMVRFSQAGPEKLSPDSKPLDINQWSAAWDTVGQGLAKIGDELRGARSKAHDLDEEIKNLEQAKQRPQPQAGPGRDVTVEIDSDVATKGHFRLTYRVSGAGWQPVYDAHLVTAGEGGKPSLELIRRASVTQRTGEDWSGVTLSVSTVRSRAGTQAPEVLTQRLVFFEPPAILNGMAKTAAPQRFENAPASAAAPEAPRAAPVGAPPAPPRERADEQQAVVEAGTYQALFQIPGKLDIPSDGSTKSFRISTAKFAPDLLVRTSPALDEVAYLQAHIVNHEDAPLLPGIVSIQRDGTYVGKGQLSLVAPGDATDIGFGADERVKVTRVPVRRRENDPTWYGATKTETREFRTSIKNLHGFPIRVNVVDRIPISENNAIIIEQLPQTTSPTEKIVSDKRGVMSWTLDLAPNAQKDLSLAYRMKWPADRDVVMQTAPNGPAR